MRLRWKVMVITAAASVGPVVAATLVGRSMLERRAKQGFAKLLDEGEAATRAEYRELQREVAGAVEQLAKGEEDPFTQQILIALAKGEVEDELVRKLTEEAPRVMRQRGLDVLTVIGPGRRVLASGHFPGQIGDTGPPARAGQQAMLLPERLLEDERPRTRLTVQAWRVARHSLGTRVSVMGGRTLDDRFIDRLRLRGDTAVRLEDARGRRLAGTRRWEPLARYPGRSVRLYDPEGREVARFRLAVPDDQLRNALRVIDYAAFGLIGGGLMLSLLLGLMARRIARPLEDLAVGAEAVAAGDLERQIPVRSRDEVGELVAAFNRMTTQLRESQERLAAAERVAAWRAIAQRIAHEIKNPLSPIQISIETLRKVHAKRHPSFEEVFEEATVTILDEVARLKRIVTEFSDFARMPKPKLAACDLVELTRAIVGLHGSAELPVALSIEGEVPGVLADREQLTQVLVNLLKNAREALVGVATPRVSVTLSRREQQVELRVADNGPGIAEQALAKLFTPYFTTKGASGGTGLGLAIAHRIVTEHGGTIEARNAPEGGALFAVRLPSGVLDARAQR